MKSLEVINEITCNLIILLKFLEEGGIIDLSPSRYTTKQAHPLYCLFLQFHLQGTATEKFMWEVYRDNHEPNNTDTLKLAIEAIKWEKGQLEL